MLVWKAMPSITPMMSPILRLLSLIPAWWRPPGHHLAALGRHGRRALRQLIGLLGAVRALWRTVEPSSSMVAAVSSRALACSSVRLDSSRLPWAICALAVAMLSAFWRTVPTTWASSLHAGQGLQQLRHLIAPSARMAVLRSPWATVLARSLLMEG
jgi:hypothetical protein